MRVTTPRQLADLMGESWTYSEEQFAAVTAPLAPAVVIAGAGSGKTSVMAGRVVWLVANGLVSPEQILGLTFTTKATGELQQRIRVALRKAGLLEGEVEEPTVATYHSYAANLLAEHGLRIGHEPDTRLIADASRYQLAARAIARYRGPVDHLSDHPATVIGNLLALDGELAEHLVDPEELRAWDVAERSRLVQARETSRAKKVFDDAIHAIDRRLELVGLVSSYRELKRHLGLMDFGDQIALTARLVEARSEVGDAERERYRVVLLDEYQDTSVAQARLLRAIFSGPTPERGLGHAVMAVGDPNQAIYGWRGASVSNILGFAADFPSRDGADLTYGLVTNRRSDARILATANHLADRLYHGEQVAPLRPADDAEAGEVRVAVHETYDDELAWLADQVRASHEGGTPWKEIGVLVRDNRHGAAVYDALVAREVPVEIVGLAGLLRLPEVAEVLATLTLVHDVTANAALLTLLTGPRWAIGPRDLALLGRRARELGGERAAGFADIREQLAAAVATADPAEVVALCDALEDPGDLDFSPEARERFALLARELRTLRHAAGEPILDLVRRIIDVTGIDVELASAVSEAAQARRENLDLFVQAVADFQSLDGQVTLPALLAWLKAEDEFGQGLDAATPSEADSVKLLTVHRAKGLEWDVVFLPGVTEGRFPIDRLRSSHLSSPQVLPVALRGDARDQPDLRERTSEGFKEWREARLVHAAVEELRLAYVAWTRPRHTLVVSCWRWSPDLQKGKGPSAYVVATKEAIGAWGAEPERWADQVDNATETNPYADRVVELPWPIDHHTTEVDRRIEAARWVAEAADPEPSADPLVQVWDDEIERLLAELEADRSAEIEVPLPPALSATALARLNDDPESFARALARPMPRRPSAAARFGTRFHAWVEQRFGQEGLFDPDGLPGRADEGIESDEDLRALIAAFEAGEFGARAPHRIEAPFAIVLGGQVVRGRIDAVYDDAATGSGSDRFLVVDWKTGTAPADPLQLAIYRLAWAELSGVPVESVRAAFYYVRTGRLDEHVDLPGREELERMMAAGETLS